MLPTPTRDHQLGGFQHNYTEVPRAIDGNTSDSTGVKSSVTKLDSLTYLRREVIGELEEKTRART